MPRTFSRGTKITAELLNELQVYLGVKEHEDFRHIMRVQYCEEAALIEKDLLPFFKFFLKPNLENLFDLFTTGHNPAHQHVIDAKILQAKIVDGVDKQITFINLLPPFRSTV